MAHHMIAFSYLPEGNYAFVHTYSLQRDPRYFSPLSDSFVPERWLSEDQREALEPKIFNSQTEFIHNTAAFIPFSVGPANCVGKNLAWIKLRMVITLSVGLIIPSLVINMFINIGTSDPFFNSVNNMLIILF